MTPRDEPADAMTTPQRTIRSRIVVLAIHDRAVHWTSQRNGLNCSADLPSVTSLHLADQRRMISSAPSLDLGSEFTTATSLNSNRSADTAHVEIIRTRSARMFSLKSWWVAVVVLAVSVVGGPAQAQPYVYALGRNSDSPRLNVLTVIDG